MGLFFTPTGAEARGKKGAPKKTIRVTAAEQKLLTCAQCPLDKADLVHPKMPPTGAKDPALYFMGEAPGKAEDETGEQFVGSSGQLIRDRIPSVWNKSIRWNNTLRCRPPGNRDPDPLESACCRRLQVEDIEATAPAVIVGFGNVPLQWLLGPGRAIGNWRGRRMPVKVGNHVCWFYPMLHPAFMLHNRDKRKDEAIRRCFDRDLARMFAEVADLPEPHVEAPGDVFRNIEVLTEYGADGLARIEGHLLYNLREVDHGLDIETNGLRPYRKDRKILTVAAGTYDATFAFPWQHPEARWTPRELKRIEEMVYEYLMTSGRKWAHEAKFEQEWFHAYYGPDVIYKADWGDTLGQAHTLDERPAKELDELTQLHFGIRLKDFSDVDVKNMEAEPLAKILPYNGGDAKYCHGLSVVQGELLAADPKLEAMYARLHSATPALVRMQAKGVVRNMPAIIQLDKDLDKLAISIDKQILAHKDVKAFVAAHGKFNPASNPDLVKFFRDFLKVPHPYARRKQQGYSCDEEALSKMRNGVAKLILERRGVNKNRDYVTPLFDARDGIPRGKHVHDDGLVHSSYSQYRTVTGRLASSDPNQQNYPRRKNKEIRRVIGCPPGHKFLAFDYGQLEARVVAAISGDKVLTAEIFNGQDIHGDWTDKIGGRFMPAQVKDNRKKVRDGIKQYWTFANFYGNVLEAVAHDLSEEFGVTISPRDLAPFFDEFWERYAGVYGWQETVMNGYWATGYVETAFGQRRHEPMNRNEIINHPIQGTAGPLVIDAQQRLSFISLEQDVPPLQPIMNIHDDLSFYLPVDGMDDLIEFIAREMILTPFDFITVPLSVEVSMGDNWADKEEIATFTTKDFQ